ncbi:leucine zipper domain-containing protein [Streptosporangium canum]|uniref:leucine zipper domain-containing protein n=1 Tax=Streptosporangium canum TaxID=324952 RepID=UPI0033BEB37F
MRRLDRPCLGGVDRREPQRQAHADAHLTIHGRALLVRRARIDGRPVAHVAKEPGIYRQCAHYRVHRYDEAGRPGRQERSSRPHRVANHAPPPRAACRKESGSTHPPANRCLPARRSSPEACRPGMTTSECPSRRLRQRRFGGLR